MPYINSAFLTMNETHDVTTESSVANKFYVHKTKLECSKGNNRVRGPLIYNKLPTEIKEQLHQLTMSIVYTFV